MTAKYATAILAAIVCTATSVACGSGEARPGPGTDRDLSHLLRMGDTPLTMRIVPLQAVELGLSASAIDADWREV